MLWLLCASRGLEMVRLAALSLLSTYTNFCFSTAPMMQARPLGSAATYCPGTMRLQPERPNVSWCTCRCQHSMSET
jgi:hypothetical protein